MIEKKQGVRILHEGYALESKISTSSIPPWQLKEFFQAYSAHSPFLLKSNESNVRACFDISIITHMPRNPFHGLCPLVVKEQ
jgi:hypothetical protein